MANNSKNNNSKNNNSKNNNSIPRFTDKSASAAYKAVVSAYGKAANANYDVAEKMRAFINCPRIFDAAKDGATADDVVNAAFADVMSKQERNAYLTVARYGFNVDGSRVAGTDGKPLSFSAVLETAKALKLASRGMSPAAGADAVNAFITSNDVKSALSVRALRGILPRDDDHKKDAAIKDAAAVKADVRTLARASERAAALRELDAVKAVFADLLGAPDGNIPGVCNINFGIIEKYVKGIPFTVDVK